MQGIRCPENKMDVIFYRIINSVNIATGQKEMKNRAVDDTNHTSRSNFPPVSVAFDSVLLYISFVVLHKYDSTSVPKI